MNLISYALSPLGKYRRIWVKKGENCSVGTGEYRRISANMGEYRWKVLAYQKTFHQYSPIFALLFRGDGAKTGDYGRLLAIVGDNFFGIPKNLSPIIAHNRRSWSQCIDRIFPIEHTWRRLWAIMGENTSPPSFRPFSPTIADNRR